MRVLWMAGLLLAPGMSAAWGGTVLVTVDLLAQSTVDFTYNGTRYQPEMSVSAIDFASSQALGGTASTPEGRTAARVGGDEIAVNARLDGKQFFQGAQID